MDGDATRLLPARIRDGAAQLPGGIVLPHAEQGDPAGPAVLLLHGFTDSWRSFLPLMASLPPGWRVVAVTLRGHGDASRPAAGYGPAELAGDVAALAAALGLGPALVVGHCMGAQVAQRLAIDHPRCVRGLVLLGAYATLRGNAAVAALQAEVAQLLDPVDPGFVRGFQEGTLARPVPPGFLDGVVAESLKLPAATWRAVLSAIAAEPAPPGLSRLAVPTLLCWGDRDALLGPAERAALAEAIPDAQVLLQPGAGHSPHWEDPAAVAAAIAGFAAELGLPW